MTLRLKHGGPVFDGLWVENTPHLGYGFLKTKEVESGAWSIDFLYKNMAFFGHLDFVKLRSDYEVDYCLAPINLIRWDKDDS